MRTQDVHSLLHGFLTYMIQNHQLFLVHCVDLISGFQGLPGALRLFQRNIPALPGHPYCQSRALPLGLPVRQKAFVFLRHFLQLLQFRLFVSAPGVFSLHNSIQLLFRFIVSLFLTIILLHVLHVHILSEFFGSKIPRQFNTAGDLSAYFVTGFIRESPYRSRIPRR